MSRVNMPEARCPDCGDYCMTTFDQDRAYCNAHGWFDVGKDVRVVNGGGV